MTSTKSFSEQIIRLKHAFESADAIVVGAGAGLSIAGGLTYTGTRFQDHFAEFIAKYHFEDMYSATFYPYESLEEYWAYMSAHIDHNRYHAPVGKPIMQLHDLLEGTDYFVITTNVDHQFQKAGFYTSKLFCTQGDYGLWQCSVPCHDKTYDNEEAVGEMLREQENLRIPSELVPHCPVCGKPMRSTQRISDA